MIRRRLRKQLEDRMAQVLFYVTALGFAIINVAQGPDWFNIFILILFIAALVIEGYIWGWDMANDYHLGYDHWDD